MRSYFLGGIQTAPEAEGNFMKQSQRAAYERENDYLRELRSCVAIIERVRVRTTERNADMLEISIQLLEIVAKDIDARLVGMKNTEE